MFIFSIPLIIVSRLSVFLNLWGVAVSLKKCIQIIDDNKTDISEQYVSILVAAEDHRYFCHYGIDPLGIARAMYVRFFRNEIQGASTIEQQFVRVVTEQYERTIRRKLIEQLLAIAVSRIKSKSDIAKTYIVIAHYGTSYKCQDSIYKLIMNDDCIMEGDYIFSVIARLKYPEPVIYSDIWISKIERRTNYIKLRLNHNLYLDY
jgi:penicillin-binding protein 1A